MFLCPLVACFVPAIANGGSIDEFILKDDQVHYTCNTGFSRALGINTTCLADGTLREAPSCKLVKSLQSPNSSMCLYSLQTFLLTLHGRPEELPDDEQSINASLCTIVCIRKRVPGTMSRTR